MVMDQKDIPGASSSPQRSSTPPSTVNGFLFQGVPASPPTWVSLAEVFKAANGVSNMVLAHEIAVNKDFVLSNAPPENSLEHQVKTIVHQAFWDVLQEQLTQNPPCYDQAMNLLAEIKKILLEEILQPGQAKIRTEINEVLDLPLIRQQLDHGVLDFLHYARWLLSLLARLVAPARDDRVKELGQETDIVPLFRGIMEVLEVTKIDLANFTLQRIRPQVQLHSIEYERHKFQEFLETQAALDPALDGLEFTKKWLRRSYDKLQAEGKPTGVQHVIHRAYLDLLEWEDSNVFPETLLMDQARFMGLRDRVAAATLVASVLLLASSHSDLQSSPDRKNALRDHLNVLLPPSPPQSEAVLEEKLQGVAELVIKELGSGLAPSAENLLKSQIVSLKNPLHPVRSLVRTRILSFISEVIGLSSDQSIKVPVGLSALQGELSKITGQFLRLVSHNRAVFGDFYTTIVEAAASDSDKSH